ncbi:hypothetical protein AB990_15290 [Alkalihalobacillus pseudalcaliphilus]|nr:hypothetical protein AB990_15290 [Alkalihalobacillus pseudalcaliphilus]
MTKYDRSAHLKEVHNTYQKVDEAINRLIRANENINFNSVSSEAGVSKATIYNNKDIRERIETLRKQQAQVPTAKQAKREMNENNKDALLREHRLNALQDCAKDMKKFNERYIPVTLPSLPFKNAKFDILLSAHFLFMYSDRLDYQFHIETLNELLRVTKEEVRIFSLDDLEGKRYEHLDKIISYLNHHGYTVEEVKVPYEFQINAKSMLKIIKHTK